MIYNRLRFPNMTASHGNGELPENSYQRLVERWRAGDTTAAEEICRLFTPRLLALIRSQLRPGLRCLEPPEVLAQSVFLSFFKRCYDPRWKVCNEKDLWALLTMNVARKCLYWANYWEREKRDYKRQISLASGETDSTAGWEPAAGVASPEEEIIVKDLIEEISRHFTAKENMIFQLQLKGFSQTEISEKAGVSERTVGRVLELFRKRLKRMLEDD